MYFIFAVDMKKSTIWIIAVVMGVSFLGLLGLQLSYLREVFTMHEQQFDESVNRSLFRVAHALEFDETRRALEKEASSFLADSTMVDSLYGKEGVSGVLMPESENYPPSVSGDTLASVNLMPGRFRRNMLKDGSFLNGSSRNSVAETARDLRRIVKERYVYQQRMLNEVIYSILYTASNKPLKERLDFKQLDRSLRFELQNNGIDLLFHFTVSSLDGKEVYRCPDYDPSGEQFAYVKVLFPNDPPSSMAVVRLHFPQKQDYIVSSVRFILPAFLFTMVLLITFIFTIYTIFRQKRLTELKNDFINNMTHEFKTPISTISLAAQMLNDPSVAKSESMYRHVTSVINDESKRLRFQVEKVLQISLFDHQKAIFKKREVDANHIIDEVVKTFTLKVQKYGGTLKSELEAENAEIYADEMHFTNVIFNLMDNAIKYSRENVPLQLKVRTWNDASHLKISVEDNGIGINRDNLKKIFDKFYRVHTGDRHDVKGFGLGLAYVKSIVDVHGGTINAESEIGHGTKFIITLPTIKI